MKTQNATTVKVKEIAKAKVITKKEKATDNATAAILINKIDKGKERPTTTKDKNYLYKFQVEEKGLSEKDQKKKRNKIRRTLSNLTNTIILANLKKKDLTPCKEFITFYKANYILNDFSLKSLTNKQDESDIKDYELILALSKESLANGK